jgi:hypothetical protein
MPFGATPSRWCVCQFHHFRPLLPRTEPACWRGCTRRTMTMVSCPRKYCNVRNFRGVSEKGQERNHPHAAFVLLRVLSDFVLKNRARDAVTASIER